MRFLVFLLFATQLSAQGFFTRYYNVVSDPLGVTTVTEFPSLQQSVLSNVKLDGKPCCLPTWVKETTSYDASGTVFPSVIEPVQINNITINSVAPGFGTVFVGTAVYNLDSKNLNFFADDDSLSVALLDLFRQQPCQKLVANRIMIGQPILSGVSYWYNVPQSVVTISFGN